MKLFAEGSHDVHGPVRLNTRRVYGAKPRSVTQLLHGNSSSSFDPRFQLKLTHYNLQEDDMGRRCSISSALACNGRQPFSFKDIIDVVLLGLIERR